MIQAKSNPERELSEQVTNPRGASKDQNPGRSPGYHTPKGNQKQARSWMGSRNWNGRKGSVWVANPPWRQLLVCKLPVCILTSAMFCFFATRHRIGGGYDHCVSTYTFNHAQIGRTSFQSCCIRPTVFYLLFWSKFTKWFVQYNHYVLDKTRDWTFSSWKCLLML